MLVNVKIMVRLFIPEAGYCLQITTCDMDWKTINYSLKNTIQKLNNINNPLKQRTIPTLFSSVKRCVATSGAKAFALLDKL